MTDNELLLAMSEMMDKKLSPIIQTKVDLMQKVLIEHSDKLQKIS